MELLAPAGTYDCLVAAVNSGADAVYFAGKGFGAFHPGQDLVEKQQDKGHGHHIEQHAKHIGKPGIQASGDGPGQGGPQLHYRHHGQKCTLDGSCNGLCQRIFSSQTFFTCIEYPILRLFARRKRKK